MEANGQTYNKLVYYKRCLCMGNYILFGLFVIIGYTVIFSLLTAASKFDDEVEELYNDYHDDLDTTEKYDYYEERYKNISNKNKSDK